MIITPKEFLRQRKPEQFSDTIILGESQINPVMLEHHLITLGHRNQELDFERFGIRLCRAEITPNLLPNTGSSGGGDSKVDSETYPVSSDIALTWFTAIDPRSATERWAFALSTQKTWKAKLRNDIKKIADTKRGYTVAYFISSQYVRAKERGEIEDELTKLYGIDVRILDRNWIIEQVFENNHQDIAEEELHIEGLVNKNVKQGLWDMQKEEAWQKIEEKIKKAGAEKKLDVFVVDDAITSAILSRELEKTPTQTNGLFERAKNLATEMGTDYQHFEIAYQQAWTYFWWHEDYKAYIQLYKIVEELALNTDNVYNLERLSNLWNLLNNLHIQDESNEFITDEEFEEHTKNLIKKLQKISRQTRKRPNSALYARVLLLMLHLTENILKKKSIDKLLEKLDECIKKSVKIIGFPLKSFIQIFTELSEYLESSPIYNRLFQTITKVIEERDGGIASARCSLSRAKTLISMNKPYEVIKVLGVSVNKLYTDETKHDLIEALYILGTAYEQVGLFWAARGVLLSAASLATSGLWEYGEINMMQAACFEKMKWIELFLGRIPQLIDWNNVDSSIRNILKNKIESIKIPIGQFNNFDVALGRLFLQTDLAMLKKLEQLPDILLEMGLGFSSIALIYALGDKEEIINDFPEEISIQELDDFFVKFIQENILDDNLYSSILDTEVERIILKTKILGCEIIINLKNQSPCIEIAESILATIESFLSTLSFKSAISKEKKVEINIDNSITKELIKYEFDDTKANPIVHIRCSNFNPHKVISANQKKIREIITDILIQIMSRFVVFGEYKKDLTTIIKDERALERALDFTSSFVTLGNVLGHHPKLKVSDYFDEKYTKYELKRVEKIQINQFGSPKKSKDYVDDNINHRDITNISIIKDGFWNQAKWLGVAYLVIPNKVPVLVLLFENIEAGKKIFSNWQNEICNEKNEDTKEKIRISIITNIDEGKPSSYKVGICSNMNLEEKKGLIVNTIRQHTMTPSNLKNLESFKEVYSRFDNYLFAPGFFEKDGVPSILFEYGIVKTEINIKKATDIKEDDLDMGFINI